jgi:hypothetical protein
LRRPRPSNAVGLGALALVLVVGFLIGGCARDLFDIDNPFREETIDRTGPAVLKSVQNIREYRAATGHFEVIVDVEQDTRLVPAEIKGQRVLFVAVGDVDAGVDFSEVGEGAVQVSDDRRTVSIELPPARFHDPELDFDRSYVYSRDRGVFDRLQSLFGDDPGDDSDLYRLAEDKLAAAARGNPGLLSQAERNTRRMLTELLRALGYTRVEIRFAEV